MTNGIPVATPLTVQPASEIAPELLLKYPELNPDQREIVGHDAGPLLVIAGPGSGKSLTLVLRAMNLLLLGKAKPSELVLCTFTEKAAFELRDRISAAAAKVGYSADLSELRVSTIHGLCHRLLAVYRATAYFNKITEELVDPESLSHSTNPFLQQIGNAYSAYRIAVPHAADYGVGDGRIVELDNANMPQQPSLSEMDVADMEGFLEQLLLIFGVLGVGVFQKPTAIKPSTQLLYLAAKGLKATGYEADEGFVVRAGSQSRKQAVPSTPEAVQKFRANLLSQGVFVEEGDHLRMTQDYTFTSPSLAASVLLGRSANGRIEWRDAKGRVLREMQQDAP
jgi:UvrD/REP helicase N-terminal domain/Domain of unknown function (DUF4357)